MARKAAPQPLTLADPTANDPQDVNFINSASTAPLSAESSRSPRSPFRFSAKKGEHPSPSQPEPELQQHRTNIPSLQITPSATAPRLPPTNTGGEERQERERPTRSGFFTNYKASKSSNRLQSSERSKSVAVDSMSKDTDRPTSPAHISSQAIIRAVPTQADSASDKAISRRPIGGPSKSDTSLVSSDPPPSSSGSNVVRKKPKPFSILRTKSIRDEPSPRFSPTTNNLEPPRPQTHNPIRTAPLRSETDRSFRDIMSSNVRQRSEDRQPTTAREIPTSNISQGRDLRESGRTPSTFSSSFREGSGHAFLSNLKTSATKGAGAIQKGLFRVGRSGSTTEKELPVDDEHYQIKLINLPLVQQTRLTRISKRLEDSRDKTEFWMPAFPWRAIDYLNFKGSDVEGLYRVPGSGPQIKKWQRRFDEERDIDLFEQDDLYDINIVGSMLKAWLRELPDELLPKSAQDRVSRECPRSLEVPDVLVEELSNLPPFNYYLLFAITCHLSLLLAHSEKNKMDFRNLCICFQPCMKIDAYCFKFLVCDWRDCWKGCKTENKFTEEEYLILDEGQLGDRPPNSAGRSSTAVESHDERNVSSSDSSKPSSVSVGKDTKPSQAKIEPRKLPLSQSQSSATISTTLTVVQEKTPERHSTSNMRPLSPIAPLSPIGFN